VFLAQFETITVLTRKRTIRSEVRMAKRLAVVLGVVLVGSFIAARAQQYPFWEMLLHSYGGKSDDTPVPSMKMGNHMQMSLKRALQPGDEPRSQEIIVAAREVITQYSDVSAALRDGYKPYYPTGRIGEEVHYTNYHPGRPADYEHPTSILYQRTSQGLQAVGVMYTARQDATADQLNAIAPLSIATWHRHIDFCGVPRSTPLDQQFGPHAKFGAQGSIHSEEACKDANGLWLPVVFGWMTHVYPNAKAPDKIWGGMDMPMDANTGSGKM
jgi:hypothetical protein